MTADVHDISALQAMDEGAWAALQDDFFRRIFFFIRRYVEDHQTAEDITQDVFLGAVRGIGRFDPIYTVDQFLYGIAKNRIIDHFRKLIREESVILRSKALILELLAFVKHDDGTMGAQEGAHDDRAIATMLTMHLIKQRPYHEKKRKPRPRYRALKPDPVTGYA